MASDEELRKVAEDVRALARSLARDFWDASKSARDGGKSSKEAFRHGVRDAARGARREFQKEFKKGMHHHRHGWGPPPWPGPWGCGPGWRPPWAPGPQPPGGPTGPGSSRGPGPGRDASGRPGPPAGPPWTQFGWWSPGYPYRHPGRDRRKGPLPPVRRKWDASVLAAILVMVFGAAWLISALGVVHLSTEAVLAAGLMLLGAALIVTARTDWSLSRHAWPVVLGAVLVVGLFATSATFGVAGALSHVSFGDMHGTISSRSLTQTVYGGFGHLGVNVAQAPNGSTVKVESIAGETKVVVDPGQTAILTGHVLAGEICLDGRSYASGIGQSAQGVQLPAQKDAKPRGTVTLDIHQLAGQVTVGYSKSKDCHR